MISALSSQFSQQLSKLWALNKVAQSFKILHISSTRQSETKEPHGQVHNRRILFEMNYHSSLLLCFWDKTLIKINLGMEILTSAYELQCLIKRSQCWNSRKETGGRNWSIDHEGTLLYCFPGIASLPLLHCPGDQGVIAHRKLGSPSLIIDKENDVHHNLVKEIPQRRFSFPGVSTMCHMTKPK